MSNAHAAHHTQTWPPCFWTTLHVAAWRCDDNRDAAPFPAILRSIAMAMPCGHCRTDLSAYVSNHPPPGAPRVSGCFAWAYALHDSVSAKIGTARMSFADALQHYGEMVIRGTNGEPICHHCADNDATIGNDVAASPVYARCDAPEPTAFTLTKDRAPVAAMAVIFGIAVALLAAVCVVIMRRGGK